MGCAFDRSSVCPAWNCGAGAAGNHGENLGISAGGCADSGGIGLGILVLSKVEVIIALIPFLLGVLVLISGCSKLQDVIDMKRMNYGNWIVMLIFAVINVIFGILLMCNPFESANLLFRLIGIGLIFSGLTDCLTTCYFARKIRRYLSEKSALESTFEEIPAEGDEKGEKS